jgi:hypothetical protein
LGLANVTERFEDYYARYLHPIIHFAESMAPEGVMPLMVLPQRDEVGHEVWDRAVTAIAKKWARQTPNVPWNRSFSPPRLDDKYVSSVLDGVKNEPEIHNLFHAIARFKGEGCMLAFQDALNNVRNFQSDTSYKLDLKKPIILKFSGSRLLSAEHFSGTYYPSLVHFVFRSFADLVKKEMVANEGVPMLPLPAFYAEVSTGNMTLKNSGCDTKVSFMRSKTVDNAGGSFIPIPEKISFNDEIMKSTVDRMVRSASGLGDSGFIISGACACATTSNAAATGIGQGSGGGEGDELEFQIFFTHMTRIIPHHHANVDGYLTHRSDPDRQLFHMQHEVINDCGNGQLEMAALSGLVGLYDTVVGKTSIKTPEPAITSSLLEVIVPGRYVESFIIDNAIDIYCPNNQYYIRGPVLFDLSRGNTAVLHESLRDRKLPFITWLSTGDHYVTLLVEFGETILLTVKDSLPLHNSTGRKEALNRVAKALSTHHNKPYIIREEVVATPQTESECAIVVVDEIVKKLLHGKGPKITRKVLFDTLLLQWAVVSPPTQMTSKAPPRAKSPDRARIIELVSPDGNVIKVTVNPTDTILALKQQASVRLGTVQPSSIFLFFGENALADDLVFVNMTSPVPEKLDMIIDVSGILRPNVDMRETSMPAIDFTVKMEFAEDPTKTLDFKFNKPVKASEIKARLSETEGIVPASKIRLLYQMRDVVDDTEFNSKSSIDRVVNLLVIVDQRELTASPTELQTQSPSPTPLQTEDNETEGPIKKIIITPNGSTYVKSLRPDHRLEDLIGEICGDVGHTRSEIVLKTLPGEVLTQSMLTDPGICTINVEVVTGAVVTKQTLDRFKKLNLKLLASHLCECAKVPALPSKKFDRPFLESLIEGIRSYLSDLGDGEENEQEINEIVKSIVLSSKEAMKSAVNK